MVFQKSIFQKLTVLTITRIVALFIILVVFSIFVYEILAERHNTTIDVSTANEVLWRDHWSLRMDTVGREQAYDEFRMYYQLNSSTDQHLAAHIIGELLYEKFGSDGFGTCDLVFLSGCIHGYIFSAVGNDGLDVIPRVLGHCQDEQRRLASCEHAVGHGLGALLGVYGKPAKLFAAIEMCDDVLSWQASYRGCPNGVLMEYHFKNFENLIRDDLVVGDILEEEYYQPCVNLTEEFRPGCYFGQAVWWKRIMNFDYALMATICRGLNNVSEKNACYYGIADNIVEDSKFDTDRIVTACNTLHTADERGACRSGVLRRFVEYPRKESREAVAILCGAASPERKSDYCAGEDLP